MSFIKRKRPRRQGDKYELMRNVEGSLVPALFKPRRGKKFQGPEDILQAETNELLARAGQYHFRLSAHVLARAHDASIGGWPDNPMITKLMPGLALLGPLELKRPGEDLRPSQVEMQTNIGTVMADTLPAVEKYFNWFRTTTEHVRKLLALNPAPPMPLVPSAPCAAEGRPPHPKGTP